ncbi:MAG: glycosyltransferase family 2 protein, partial [Flammeovirgaceae bacterium]
MNEKADQISLVILTYNALHFLDDLLNSIEKQTINPEIIIVDSSSTDGTIDYLIERNITPIVISKSEFNHGGTRNYALNLATNNIVVFLTQDVILEGSDSLRILVDSIEKDCTVAMSYGRQLPKRDATILSQFARINNYPAKSVIKSSKDIAHLGIKTCLISNSFAAYNKEILIKLGGFPSHLIMCEDVFVGAKAILRGFKIA